MHSEGSQRKRRIKNPRSHSFLLVDAADDAHIDT